MQPLGQAAIGVEPATGPGLPRGQPGQNFPPGLKGAIVDQSVDWTTCMELPTGQPVHHSTDIAILQFTQENTRLISCRCQAAFGLSSAAACIFNMVDPKQALSQHIAVITQPICSGTHCSGFNCNIDMGGSHRLAQSNQSVQPCPFP